MRVERLFVVLVLLAAVGGAASCSSENQQQPDAGPGNGGKGKCSTVDGQWSFVIYGTLHSLMFKRMN